MAGPRVEITGATPVDGDGRGRLEVAYTVLARRATDVVELEVEVEHDAGVLTGRLAPPPLVGGAGRGTADIDARALPAGRAIVRITPVGRRGGRGDPGVLPVAVPATGADPGLRIVAWDALDPAVAAPGARSVATPRLHLVWEGAGEAAAHITVERPDGRTGYAVVTAPPGGTGTVAPLRLDDRAPAGEYRVTARLVGAGGAMSDPATATVRVGERGVATPRVERMRWRGAHGDLVVRGGGFDGPDLAVLIDGAPVPVATVGPDELVVHAAGLVDDATLEVRTAHGSGTARARVRPRVALRIEPEDPVATEGEAIRLQAVVTGTRDGAVAWSLEDAAAGVTLGEDGTLTAGVDAPETVTVRAASAIDPKVTATATVRILPPSGPAAEIGARGGRVASPDGRAVLSVAPGALDTPAAVEVRPRRARPAGRGEIVAAEVAMTGAALAGEATLEVALETHAAPGSKLTVVAEERGRWKPIGEALVGAQGMTAVATFADRIPDRIRLIPEVSRIRDLLPAEPSVPVITAIEGSPPVEEGATVAVLVTGTNFVPGASYVSVRLNDAVDNRIQAGATAVTRDGTKLATTIRVDPIPELPGGPPGSPGVLSQHVLRVQTPAGHADAPFPILGRDEIRVMAGQVVTVNAPVRLSRLDVDQGGRLDVASAVPPVTIDVLGEAQIWGDVRVVTGTGAPGGSPPNNSTRGPGGAGGTGAGPFNAGGGGAGGAGGLIGVGDPTALTVGLTGSAGLGSRPGTIQTGGAGGMGSNSAGWGPFPHGGEPAFPGASPPNPHIVNAATTSYPPGFAPGAGGGGGGGGGGEGLLVPGRPGGGGGGGGAGGGAVRIAAGRELWAYGNVVARGGDGGRGALGSGDDWIRAGNGGSGGGGGGGAIHVAGLMRGQGALVATSGATPRAPGSAVVVEARTALQIALDSAPTGEIRADGFVIGACRPAPMPGPDLFHEAQLVATAPQWEFRGLDANYLAVRNGEDTEFHPIAGEHVFPQYFTHRNRFFVRTVPLRPGFNYVRAQRWMEDAPFPMEINALLMESADVRERRILYLPDTIAAYEFAVSLTPAALTVPTERSGTIAASVTASQTTALLWSVVGGADFGTVTAETNGARYTAPSRPPAGGVLVRAASSLDPNRSSTTPVTVLPGIRIVATAASGTPAVPALPSANAGQGVEVQIPPEAFAITQAGFAGVQVEVPTLRPAAAGGCERGVLPVAAVVAPGLQSLTATLPACASPRGWVRVPGHGSAELQVVPVVTSFEGDRASEPYVTVRGTGFACGETQVVIGGTPLPATEVQAVTCGSLRLATWPAQGAMLSVRTVGGESVPVPVP